MIIVWRGWGGVAAAFFFLGAMCGAMATSVTENGSLVMLSFGLGFLAFGVAGWLLGHRLNVTRPTQEIDSHVRAVETELWNRVQTGVLPVAAGVPAPRSAEEALQQVGYLVAQERSRAEQALRNRHTLFWVPMQYWGMIEMAIGGVLTVVALTRLILG
ncbi:hypothetical protein [Actinomyces sp. MRS3W]|uniref:hypothetical protein n=1 Tax=Actinomyces sp. MRS3W TaxID=2800796 RepID=UPI0028FCFC95|nr:hypothetical protein [Actinomyces sp. MRS3W]MDU0349659.1 hypothetical protein [Actinomyces sp. MRS3W]